VNGYTGVLVKSSTKISRALLAVMIATAFGGFVGISPAHAIVNPEPLGETPTVVGYDDEGSPVYATNGTTIADPEESWIDEIPVKPAATVDEVTEYPESTGETCTPRTTTSITNIPNSLKVDWADGVINNKPNPVKYQIKAETSTKFSWNVSGSVSGEFKAGVFTKVSATINGGIAHEKTSTYGSTVDVVVDGHDTVKVDRGMWQEKFNYSYYSVNSGCLIKRGSGTGQAPYRQAWHIY